MSESAVYCPTCERWWRPEQMRRIAKQRRAPDGGPSGYCKACWRARKTEWYYRMKADRDAYEAYLARAREARAVRRAAWTPEYRREVYRRAEASRDRARLAARTRRYRAAHRDQIRKQKRKWHRAYMARIRETNPARLDEIRRQNRESMKRCELRRVLRLAAVLRVAVRGTRSGGGAG